MSDECYEYCTKCTGELCEDHKKILKEDTIIDDFDKVVFNQIEIDFFKKKFREFLNVHADYINNHNGHYVYGRADDVIIVFEKLEDTIHNECRQDIVSSKYATYIANKLKIVLMFDKYNPEDTLRTHISIPEICGLITYTVGDVIDKKNFKLRYYKSIIVPYLQGSVHDNYTGFYVGWYDNGFISEKGNYYLGERTGIWKFGSSVKKTPDVSDKDFTLAEYENGNFKKEIKEADYNSMQLVVYTPPTLRQTSPYADNQYVKLVWNGIALVTNYLDYYIPGYIPQDWKTII